MGFALAPAVGVAVVEGRRVNSRAPSSTWDAPTPKQVSWKCTRAGACVLPPRPLPCGACEDSHVPACLSPGADGSVAACLEDLSGSRGQLPACRSPSVS